MNWYKLAKQQDYRTIGNTYWFEYHCYEGHDSADAQLWYRSHQKVKVLSLVEKGYGKTKIERGDNGQPAVDKIQFEDGFIGDAMEDEIMYSTSEFFRPNPPKPSSSQKQQP